MHFASGPLKAQTQDTPRYTCRGEQVMLSQGSQVTMDLSAEACEASSWLTRFLLTEQARDKWIEAQHFGRTPARWTLNFSSDPTEARTLTGSYVDLAICCRRILSLRQFDRSKISIHVLGCFSVKASRPNLGLHTWGALACTAERPSDLQNMQTCPPAKQAATSVSCTLWQDLGTESVRHVACID